MPEVSVIIPTYNYAHYLGEAIISVLNQTYQDFELIIVDDGSTDNTRELVNSFANSKIRYIYQKNQGTPAAENTGIRAATGDYIAILGADDQWLPRKLELQIKALEASSRIKVVYSDMYYFGSTDPKSSKTFFQLLRQPPPRGKVLDKLAEHNFIQPSTLLIKREVLNQVGLFDEKLRYCDDYDLAFRMAAYCEFEVINTPLVKYRLHDGQLSQSNIEGFLRDHITFIRKSSQLAALGPDARHKLDYQLADYHYRYCIFALRKGKLIQGFDEMRASLESDAWAAIPLSINLSKRVIGYFSRRTKKGVHSAAKLAFDYYTNLHLLNSDYRRRKGGPSSYPG